MEYTISYGTNGLDYAEYKEPSGNAMVRLPRCARFRFLTLLSINIVAVVVVVMVGVSSLSNKDTWL